jgi:Ca2+-dependent lipid-binding protein
MAKTNDVHKTNILQTSGNPFHNEDFYFPLQIFTSLHFEILLRNLQKRFDKFSLQQVHREKSAL